MVYKFNGKLFTDFNDYKIALKESSDRFNSYAPWSNEEDEALLNGFDKGLSIKQLSDLHKRRGGGIRSRLKKLRPEDFSFENKNPPQEVFKENILLQVVEDLQTLHRKELSRGLPTIEALRNTIINTGSALMITTTVLVSGFLVLTLSAFLPTFQFGLLSALMIALALICDLTLLPALCIVLSKTIKD